MQEFLHYVPAWYKRLFPWKPFCLHLDFYYFVWSSHPPYGQTGKLLVSHFANEDAETQSKEQGWDQVSGWPESLQNAAWDLCGLFKMLILFSWWAFCIHFDF